MVSRSQSVLISIALLAAAAASGADTDPNSTGAKPSTATAKPKFYRDDPLWKEPRPHPVTKMKTIEIDNLYDFIDESFAVPRHDKKLKRTANTAALNANTLGEVPDSEWYTNRHASHPMTTDELVRGPGNADPRTRTVSGR